MPSIPSLRNHARLLPDFRNGWCALVWAALFWAASAHASTQTWIGSSGLGGAGLWSGTSNWTPATWGPGNTALFSGTAGTVTVGTETAGGLTFNTAGYMLASGTLTLYGGSQISLTSGTTTFASTLSLAGTGGVITVAGPGTLSLNTTNGSLGTGASPVSWTVTGGTYSNGIFSSILSIGAGNNLGATPTSATTQLTLDGGTLVVTGTGLNPPIGPNRSFVVTANGGAIVDTGDNSASSYQNAIADNAGASTSLYLSNPGGATVFSGIISGTGGVTWTGVGTLSLSASNTYSGGTTVGMANAANAGTVQLTSTSSALGIGPVTVYGGTLNLNNATQAITTLTLGGGAAGSAATLATGTAGLLNLGGTVTYNGTNNPGAASISGFVNLNGTTSFVVNSSTSSATNLTVSAVLQNGSATSALIKNGTGTLDLTASNTFTGGITLNSGTLGIYVGGSLGPAPGSVTTELTFAGNSTLRFDQGLLLVANRGFLINNGVTATFNTNGGSSMVNQVLAASGETGVLNMTGGGTLTLGNNASTDVDDSYLTVIATSGTLVLNKDSNASLHAIGGGGLTVAGAQVNLAGSGGDQIYNGAPVAVNSGTFNLAGESETIGSLSGSAGGIVTDSGTSASALTVGGSLSAGTGAYSGSITDNTSGGGILSITMAGSGTLTLSGSNSFTGGATISAGTIAIANNNALGSGTLSIGSGGTLSNGDSVAHTLGNNIAMTGTVTYAPGPGLTLTGTLSSASAVTVIETGTSTLTINTDNSGTIAASSSWTVQGGGYNSATGLYNSILAINSGRALGNSSGNTLTLNAGTLQFTANGGNGYASSRTIDITSGGGAISDGGYAPGNATAGGAATNPNIVIAAGAGLNLVSTDMLDFASGGGVISGSGGIAKFGAGTVVFGGSNSYQGGTIINGGVLQFAADTSLGTGTVTLNGGTLASAQTSQVTMTRIIATGATGGGLELNGGAVSSSSNKWLLSAANEITGSGPIVLSNNGILSIGAANTAYSGNWTLNGGVMELTNQNAAGSGGITVNTGAELSTLGSQITNALTLNGGDIGWDYYSNSGNYEGPVNLLALGGTVSLANYYGAGAINGAISGNISGAGGLAVSDSGPSGATAGGALTLSGSNSFTGGITIGAGAGVIAAASTALGSSTNALSLSGTLDMNGYNLSVGALSLPGGGYLDFTFGANTVEHLSAASASASGTTYLQFNPDALSGAGTYTLVSSNGGGLAGAFQIAGASDLTVPVSSLIVRTNSNTFEELTLSNSGASEQVTISAAPSKVLTIMPFGSSITAGQSAQSPYDGGGYRTQLYQDLVDDGRFTPNFAGSSTNLLSNNPSGGNILTSANELNNEGHPGWTTLQMLANLDMNNGDSGANGGYWLAPGNGVNPNIITVNIGGNDAVDYGTTSALLGQAAGRLDAIISDFNTLRPGVATIISSICYRGDGNGAYSAGLDAYYNPLLTGIVFNHVLAGQNVSFLDLRNIISYPADIGPDDIHPTQAGYDIMANAWYQSIAYGSAYWTGSQGGVWNTVNGSATNWDMDASMDTDRGKALNDPTTNTYLIYPDVYFSNNTAPLTTTLGANTTIRSLNFTSGATGSVTIGAGNTLTIGAVDSSVVSGATFTLMNSGGITVQAGSGAHTIAANIILGAAQTWGNVSSNLLTVSGAVSGTNNLSFIGSYTVDNPGTYTPDGTNYADATYTTTATTVTGGGLFLLSGSDSYTGATTLGAGANVIVSGSLTGTPSASVGAGSSLEVDGLLNNSATTTLSGTLRGTGSVGAITASGGVVAPGLSTADSLTATGTLTAAGAVSLSGSTNFDIRLGMLTGGTDADELNVTGGSAVSLNGAQLSLTLGSAMNNAALAGDFYTIISGGAGATGVGGDIFSGLPQDYTFNVTGGYKFTILYAANANGTDVGSGSDVVLKLDAVPEPSTWAATIGGFAMMLAVRRIRRRR